MASRQDKEMMRQRLEGEMLSSCMDFLDSPSRDEVKKNEQNDFNLDEIIEMNAHFPQYENGNLLKFKCLEALKKGDHETAAYSILRAHGISFQHQVLRQKTKKLSSKLSNQEEDIFTDRSEDPDVLFKSSMTFQSTMQDKVHVEKMLKKLPSNWRIVQLTTEPLLQTRFKPTKGDEAIAKVNFPLIVTQISCGDPMDIVVTRLPPLANGDLPSILQEFDDIMDLHLRIFRYVTKEGDFDKRKYNENRNDVDARLDSLLKSVQNAYLGYNKAILLGKPPTKEREDSVNEIVENLLKLNKHSLNANEINLLRLVVDGSTDLSRDEVFACLQSTFPRSSKKILDTSLRQISDFKANNPLFAADRHPVVLILDREIQKLPWEAMPMLSGQPISRVPSVAFLCALHEVHEVNERSVLKTGFKDEEVFYILNPDQNLKKTQERLEAPFQAMNLHGISGQKPTAELVRKALTERDAYVWCSHGDGTKYMAGQEVEKLDVRAVPLLFGCKSGKLSRLGRNMDPLGLAHSYLIGTAPCLLGFLWSVTDRDLDQWTLRFLEYWLGKEDNERRPDLVRAVSERRNLFQRSINRSAAVVYGLPTATKS